MDEMIEASDEAGDPVDADAEEDVASAVVLGLGAWLLDVDTSALELETLATLATLESNAAETILAIAA